MHGNVSVCLCVYVEAVVIFLRKVKEGNKGKIENRKEGEVNAYVALFLGRLSGLWNLEWLAAGCWLVEGCM